MIQLIHRGGVASAQGFTAGGVHAGIKTAGDGVFDLGIVLSDSPASAAGVFSQNKVLSPSVTLSSRRIANGRARAIVANSGCANCSVGRQGLTDAEEMTALAAAHVDVDPDEVLIGSTGLIGVELPMALVRQNLGNIILSDDGGNRFARSIMTTDTHPKEVAVSTQIDGREIVIGGCAKGSGMIHPNMATMLSFITTDAAVEPSFLQQALKDAADASFNMIDVDGDQSTNDTLIVLANGRAGGDEIRGGTSAGEDFQEALTYVCVELAKEMARDGEGATHLVEVTVEGADTLQDARQRRPQDSLLPSRKGDDLRARPELGPRHDGPRQQRNRVRGVQRGHLHQRDPHCPRGHEHRLSEGRRRELDERGRGENKGQRWGRRRYRFRLGLRPYGRVRNRKLGIQHVVANVPERLSTRVMCSGCHIGIDEAWKSIESARKAASESAEARQ